MENQGASGLQNLSGIAIILVLAGLWMLEDSPLTAKRPEIDAAPPSVYQPGKRIPARLWQDPFEAIERHFSQAFQSYVSTNGKTGALSVCGPTDALGDSGLAKIPERHKRLFVMIPGGSFAEDREFRRRLRYAVHSALSKTRVEATLSGAMHAELSMPGLREPDSQTAVRETIGGAGGPVIGGTQWLEAISTRQPVIPDAAPRQISMSGMSDHGGPVDPERVGLSGVFDYIPPSDDLYYPAGEIGLWCWNGDRNGSGDASPIIAYEDFSNPNNGRKLRLYWLKESDFGNEPLLMLSRLLAETKGKGDMPGQQTPVILGPWSSGTLEAMAEDARGDTQTVLDAIVLSPSATKPDKALLSGAGNAGVFQAPVGFSSLNELFRHTSGFTFLRTIPRNDALARSLIRELKLRGVDPVCSGEKPSLLESYSPYPTCGYGFEDNDGNPKHTQHIVLIYEWDTAFARSLRDSFVEEVTQNLRSKPDRTRTDKKPVSPDWIHEFTYLRGLDGQLPVTGRQIGITGNDGKAKALAPDIDAPGNLEPAHGRSQFDYLRRLTRNIERLDSQLRDNSGGRERIRAFGILGSDFYDKLLILQALRERFPGHLFFSTDLDARFLDSENYRWTRNLIIASGFGLRMHRNWQATTAPFRSGYETSFFFSTQLANSGIAETLSRLSQRKLDEALHPLVFEVSRSGFVNLPQKPEASSGARQIRSAGPANRQDAEEAGIGSASQAREGAQQNAYRNRPLFSSLHPEADHFGLHPRFSLWTPVLAVLTATLLLLTANPLRRRIGSLWQYLSVPLGRIEPARVREYRIVRWGFYLSALWLVGAIVFLCILLGRAQSGQLLEPFTLLAGVSIWPSELLRLMAALMCVVFIFSGMRAVFATDRSLEREFGLGKGDAEDKTRESWLMRWRGFLAWCTGPGESDPQALCGQPRSKRISGSDPALVWRDYTRYAGFWYRTTRILVWGAIFYGIGLIGVYGFEPLLTPHRGDFAFWASTVIGLFVLGIPFLMLLFGTLDEALLSNCLIRHLTENPMNWGQATKRCRKRMPGLRADLVNAWITVEFLAKRTAAASNLTYYPFIVILVILLSLSSRFDKWDTPASVLGIVSLCVVVAMTSAVLLRRTAQKARRAILDRIEEQIYEHSSETAPTESDRLKLLVERMRNLDEGAFRRWYQEPAVKALFWVLGVASLLMTEYVISAG